ncbi:Histone-lysine N-methyltransferase SETMAR [Habropoda laboriosa]|uniref:Histone-lysine N-methyltransferase SETMAR n=1 Tax=Habropoda laboriosa TaxID=597456 RepID=A0A0L7R5N8_9HYME|nr:Histone-lysine N-methyltransferase SETMAR [Habropoda laboriosa]
MHKKLFVEQASLVNREGPILLHDNGRPQVSQFTIRKIHELGYETLKHREIRK